MNAAGKEPTVRAALLSELRSRSAAGTPEGRVALRLADLIDGGDPRLVPSASAELRRLLDGLRSSAMPMTDPVDEIRARRDKRRA